MSKKLLLLGLLFLLAFSPTHPALALDAEPAAAKAAAAADDPEPTPDIEELELDSDPTTSAAASIVCRFGHWRNGPRQCRIEHIDALIGPLAPCSYIKVGGRWYHIVAISGRTLYLRALSATPVPEA